MGIVIASDEVMDILKEIKFHRDVEKKAKQLKEKCTQKLYNIVGENERIATDDGEEIATWKYDKDSEKFDKDTFKALYSDIYKQFVEVKPGARKLDIKLGGKDE